MLKPTAKIAQTAASLQATEIRTLSYLVHPPFLDKLGLGAALQWYVEGFTQRTGIEVSLVHDPNLERFPEEIELALYRVLQEALTNVHRHSGSQRANIQLHLQDSQLRLEIRDNGTGFGYGPHPPRPEILGVGISTMRERIEQLGGQFAINSTPQGTTVRAVLVVNDKISAPANS